MSTPSIEVYQFKITLKDLLPPVWRQIQVPGDYTFWDLHVAIQDAMGWLDYHLHTFELTNPETGQKEEIGIADEDFGWDDPELQPGWQCRISEYFTYENRKCLYIYDFGDVWQHEIMLEKILPMDKQVRYPVCLSGKRACPPEDSGGVQGYSELLEVLLDEDHELYEEILGWVGEDFDPEHFDIKDVHFQDPKERWEYAFEDETDFDVGPDVDVENELLLEFRAFHRGHMHDIWEKAKSDELDDLDPEQRRLAGIMLAHEEEFFNAFEFADLTAEMDFNPDTDVNPFLHIAIHSVVETQLEERDPIEAFQFYNAMRKKKCSHHDAIHLIGAILAPMIFGGLMHKVQFDLDTYKTMLKKYKTRKPEKIMDLLENDLAF